MYVVSNSRCPVCGGEIAAGGVDPCCSLRCAVDGCVPISDLCEGEIAAAYIEELQVALAGGWLDDSEALQLRVGLVRLARYFLSAESAPSDCRLVEAAGLWLADKLGAA